MLEQKYTAVLEAKDRQSLLNEVIKFASLLEFDTVSATVVVDSPSGTSKFYCVDNTPPGYRDVFEDLEQASVDPVMQHCKRASVPIIWNQDTYTSVGKGAMWERQARFGYCSGIALAFHLPRGQHFFIGIDRAGQLPKPPAAASRLAGDLQLFAAHALASAIGVLLPDSEPHLRALTVRERECLLWTAEGKTAWELGCILGINEQTAVRHLSNATQKLECVNKYQAIAKAIRLGLIR